MNISEIDPNFKAKTGCEEQLEFFDIRIRDKFHLTGVFWDEVRGCYARIPQHIVDEYMRLSELSCFTAGGQVSFVTDSPVISAEIELFSQSSMPHMPNSGASGLDLFREGEFVGKLIPNDVREIRHIQVLNPELLPNSPAIYSINMPLYNGLRSMKIGIKKGSMLKKAGQKQKRILFYGSSITQGGCASKPGNAYTTMIARKYNLEQINLGFSGNAKGELEIAEYITTLKPDIIVLDYDHNADSLEDLQVTHQPFFRMIRKNILDIPVVMVSMPPTLSTAYQEIEQRRDVIMKTYSEAHGNGDENVYYVDGQTLFDGLDSSSCTMDGSHPNDLGFYRMAKIIGGVVEQILEKNKACSNL